MLLPLAAASLLLAASSSADYLEVIPLTGVVNRTYDGYEEAPYTLVNTFDGGVEERVYPSSVWACVKIVSLNPSSIFAARQSLLRYFSGNNFEGTRMATTVPLSVREKFFFLPRVCAYVGASHQKNPPEPRDFNIVERMETTMNWYCCPRAACEGVSDYCLAHQEGNQLVEERVHLHRRPTTSLYAYRFGGAATMENKLEAFKRFAEAIKRNHLKTKILTTYDNEYDKPTKLFDRRNELWIPKEVPHPHQDTDQTSQPEDF